MIGKKLRRKIDFSFLIISCCLATISCKRESAYLYDKASFPPTKQYSPPVQYPRYAPYQRPNSRAYSNPYAQPPQNYYPYYDTDQYYVPPNYYNNYYYNDEGNTIDPNVKY